MAIINGNTDFNLKLTRSGKKGIKVDWSKKGGIGYNGKVEIFRADDKLVYTKDYSQTTASGSFVYDCEYLSEYKVHIKSNNGYTYDFAYIPVHLTQVETKTHTYTAADVKAYQDKSLLAVAAMTVIGVTMTITSAILTIAFGASDATTTRVSFPAPRVGDTMTTTLTPKTGGFETTLVYNQKAYTDSSGNKQSAATYKMNPVFKKYLVYPR